MILFGLLFVLGAIGLLIAGLAQGNTDLIWASIAASAVAGLAVAVAALQGRRAPRDTEPPNMPGAAGPEAIPAREVAPPVAASTHVLSAVDAPEPVPAHSETPIPGVPVDFSSADPGQDADPEDEELDPVGEPGEEEVDMADLLVVIDLTDEVLVVDLRPRYHMAVCGHLDGREAIPLPVGQAREDGFTPCGLCRPDAMLAGRARQLNSADN